MIYEIVPGDYYEKDRVVVAIKDEQDPDRVVSVNAVNTRHTIDLLRIKKQEIDAEIAFNEQRLEQIDQLTTGVVLAPLPEGEL